MNYQRTKEHSRKILESRRKNGKPWFLEETKKKISKSLTGKISPKKNGEYVKCKKCGKEIYRARWQLKRKNDNYCSKECSIVSCLNTGIPWNKGGTFSEESRKKMSETHKKMTGEKSNNWMGGISFEPYSVDWTETLKRAIRERDKYICQLCSSYGKAVHHIDYDKKNCNPDNLITLCRKCHSKTNFNRKFWMDYFLVILNGKK